MVNIIKLDSKEMSAIAPLFEGWEETLIWSCLQGCMGNAWTTSEDDIITAQIIVGDFCFYAGEVSTELLLNKPTEYRSGFIIIVPQDERWAAKIEEVYGEHAKRLTRYSIKKEPGVFDIQKLTGYVTALSSEYELKLIDEEIYDSIRKNPWSFELCSQFDTYEAYHENGLGIAVLHKGEAVAGASSYTVYREGIEVSIVTREDFRRRGLALACGARLILECISRNLYPSWDASNKASLILAERLGYHFEKEYTAYFVDAFGNPEPVKG